MLLFGGLVNEKVRNDLWSIDIRDLSVMHVKTKGDAPPPRVGHASVIMDKVMVVWGGDTKVNVTDEQDEGLYILDLRKSIIVRTVMYCAHEGVGSQEWTKVPISKGPIGRYGHAACMVENRFYVFGGQADGMFMNDMWMYDIKQCMFCFFPVSTVNCAFMSDSIWNNGSAYMEASLIHHTATASSNRSCVGGSI